MCVCPAACRWTYTTYHPEIWHGLLISTGLGTKLGGDPKFWPPGVPPVVTLSKIPWRVKNWAGASKQKLLLGVGLDGKILFAGGSPQPRSRRVHPTKGVYALRIGWEPANKGCSSGWVSLGKFYLWRADLNPGPGGSTQPNGGICFEKFTVA
jgi:hypothetical protein